MDAKRFLVTFAAVVTIGTPMFAQERSGAERVRDLNTIVLQHQELRRQSGSVKASADIVRRENALADLIASDPDAALRTAFAPDLLDQLRAAFPDSASHFERQGAWTGTLEAAIEDSLDGSSKTVQVFTSGAGSFFVYTGASQPFAGSGRVTITGVAAGGNIATAKITRADLPQAVTATSTTPTGSGPIGQQNIVTILVNLPGYKLPANVTSDFMSGVFWGNANVTSTADKSATNWYVDDYWQQASDGKTSAPVSLGKVIGPYLLTSNYNTNSNGASYCDYIDMKQAVLNAVGSAVDFTQFNRVVIVIPNNVACIWSGVSGIGYWSATELSGTAFTASFSWLRSDTMTSRLTGVQLASHELGHGFGLNHGRSRTYPGSSAIPLGAINSAGTLAEYGDNFTPMGNWNTGFYNAQHQVEILGWLTPANYTVVQTAGQYTIQAYETRNASGMVKALKVLRDAASGSWMWLELRTNTGNYDSQLSSQVFTGALIHYEDSLTGAGYTNLLNYNPAITSVLSPALAAGLTWSDPYSNLAITVNSITASTMTVTIGYGTPGCAPAPPTTVLSPLNPTVTASGSTSFTVKVTSNKAASCPVSSYSLAAAQPAGFSGIFAPATLSLGGGASGSVILTETAGSAVGTFPLLVTATDTSASGLSGTGIANITVAPPCTMANPTVSLSPSAVSLAASGSTALTLSVTNNNSLSCAASTYNLSAVQPTAFTGTLSKTSLASVASGATASITITETAGASTGTFTLSATATDAAKSTATGTGSAAITVLAACTPANPTVTLTPAAVSVASSGSTSLTITVTNNNSSGCAASSYNLTAVQPTGFVGTLSKTSLASISSGATATATISETAGTTAGTFAVKITATDAARSTSAGTGSANVTVAAAACTLAAPVVTSNPALASLKASASTTFSISVQNANSASCPSTVYTLTATQPAGFTGSLSGSSVTLASGATGTVTLAETAGTTTGTFTVSVAATAGSLSKSASIAITVPAAAKTSSRLTPSSDPR